MWMITVWFFIIFFLVTAMIGTYMLVMDVVAIAILICAWYTVITETRGIEVGEDKLHIVTECRNDKENIKIDEEFQVADIVRMGYTRDLYGHPIYHHRNNSKYCGPTQRYEVVFELNNGKRVFIDLDFLYTKKQQREIFQYIHEINGLKPEGKLRRDLKID